MKNIQKYNKKIYKRVNDFFRKFRNENNKKRLLNFEPTILCNNCTGGIILHDLGLEFKTPTINLFFRGIDFFKFVENLDYYLGVELKRKEVKEEYPVFNLGDLELHFLHYKNEKQAIDAWDRRKKRINKDNLYIMWTFFGGTDEKLLERFENLPYKNKIAFTEKDYRTPNSYYIKGFEEEGLGVLTLYDGIFGHKIIDQFDYVSWLNKGKDE